MYPEVRASAAAGVLMGSAVVEGRGVMVTPRCDREGGGVFFPATCKKGFRGAERSRPVPPCRWFYLVDRRGFFLCRCRKRFFRMRKVSGGFSGQRSAFGDGRFFRSMRRSWGTAWRAARYLPVLCDKVSG